MKTITINWNDKKSIKQAEKKKTMYENRGYSLLRHICGPNETDIMYYKTN